MRDVSWKTTRLKTRLRVRIHPRGDTGGAHKRKTKRSRGGAGEGRERERERARKRFEKRERTVEGRYVRCRECLGRPIQSGDDGARSV